MINIRNNMLEYLWIMEYKLIDMLSIPNSIIKINKSNFRGYVHDKLKRNWLVKLLSSLKPFSIPLKIGMK